MACFLLERNCDKPLYTTPLHTASDLVLWPPLAVIAETSMFWGEPPLIRRCESSAPDSGLLANPRSGTKDPAERESSCRPYPRLSLPLYDPRLSH